MSSGTEHLLSNGRLGTWDLDLAAGTIECSAGFRKLLELPPRDSVSLTQMASRLIASDGARLTRAVAQCRQTHSDLRIDVRVGSGEHARRIELRAELQVADDGTAERLKGIASDAMPQREQQDALRHAAFLLRAVLENASGMIYAKDLDGRLLMANPPVLELIGLGWEDVRGRTDAEFLADRAQALAVMANDRRIIDGGQTEVFEEQVGIGEGCVRTFLSTKTPLRDDSGAIIGLVGISQDITDRKAAVRKLVELNETLEVRVAERTRERDSAWKRSQDLLLVLDGTGIFKAVNPAWTAVLGWEHDELVNHNVLEFIHPDDYSGTLNALAHAGSDIVSSYQNRYRHKDGTYRWIEWSAAPEGDRVHASGRHVTAQKEAELALAEKTAQLQISNKELESFSYSVSHDLRAPLRAVDGFGMMLEEDYAGRLDDEGRRLLSTIRQNSRRMGQLIDDLLGFSRLAHVSLAAAEVDIDSLVREVVQEISASLEADDNAFAIEPLHQAYGDRQLLRQVWINLLSNAVKYSANQSKPAIAVHSQLVGSEVVYSVRDNGVGFDMKYADKLFGVFQRLHSATEFSGTGVGLAIVHRIVTRHGGRIWASGIPSQGAVFSFALPAKDFCLLVTADPARNATVAPTASLPARKA